MKMKRLGKCLSMLTLIVAFGYSNIATSAEVIHLSTIKMLYPLADGSFVLIFNADSPSCPNAITPKYYYVSVGNNGVTLEGSKKMYAAAALAMAMNKQVNIAFDNATSSCFINRLTVIN